MYGEKEISLHVHDDRRCIFITNPGSSFIWQQLYVCAILSILYIETVVSCKMSFLDLDEF